MSRRAVRLLALGLAAAVAAGLAVFLHRDAIRLWKTERDLRRGGVETRLAAAEALLARADPATVPALVAALSDESAEVRATALWALGTIGDPAARPAVRARLAAASDLVELRHAAWAAGQLRDAEAVDRLADLAARPPPRPAAPPPPAPAATAAAPAAPSASGAPGDAERVRFQATAALGLTGGERAVESLAALASDPDERVRYLAAVALGNAGTPRGVEVLIERLEREPSDLVLGVIVGSLRQIAGPAGGAPEAPDARAWRAYWRGRGEGPGP